MHQKYVVEEEIVLKPMCVSVTRIILDRIAISQHAMVLSVITLHRFVMVEELVPVSIHAHALVDIMESGVKCHCAMYPHAFMDIVKARLFVNVILIGQVTRV